MARQPRIGSSRLQEGGLLATHKQDYNAHVEGGGFRHTADHIDMNPSLAQFNSPDVQGTLELIAGFAASAGSGFVSVGNQTSDGYATGSYNVTDSFNFRQALTAAFNDNRLQNGGYVLVLNGTYQLDTTVTIPPGITILGEPSGTIINSQTSEASMFVFESGTRLTTIGGDSGGGALTAANGPYDSSGLSSLILVDNLDGYNSGAPTMTTTPMVQVETGASVKISDTKFLGRVSNGAVLNRTKTLRAIGTTSGSPEATTLEVSRCLFDGLKTGIQFTPGAGDIDHLIIKNCRARIFGDEGGAFNDVDNNFTSMSLCNFLADNNYVVAANTGQDAVYNCFLVTTLGSGGSDVSVVISNTYGNPSTLEEVVSVYAAATSLTANLQASVTNNNWGGSFDSQWAFIVGDGQGASSADFQGAGALDLVLNYAFDLPTTVYVQPGTYTITSAGNDRYDLVGIITDSGNRPLINLNMSGAATDEISNSVLYCGRTVKNLKFVTTNASFQGVRPGGAELIKEIVVKNCIFENAGLSFSDTSSTTLPELIEVNNCRFNQTGAFDDNISLLAPNVDNVVVRNSTFTGYGYAGMIGNDTTISYTTSEIADILIEGCVFDQVGFTINDASPLGVETFFGIFNPNGRVTLKNNRVAVAASNQVAGIASDTRTSADFESYIQINADIIQLENNSLNCAYRTYDVSAVNYILPGLLLSPVSSLRIKDNYFFNCLCQIGTGLSAALSGQGDGVCIENNFFLVNDNDYVSATVLDIDTDPSGGASSLRRVLIENNTFYVRPSSAAPTLAYHAVSGAYTTVGVVQVFADDVPVYFKGNAMDANTPTLSTETVISGLVVNNKAVGNVLLPACQIVNNDLYVINNFTSGDSAEVAATVYVDCTNLQIFDNEIAMDNSAGVAESNQSNCLYILTNQNAGGQDPTKALVKGNSFSRRRKTSGAAISLTAFVKVDSSSQPGLLTDNVFSDDTTNGTVETLFDDDSNTWSSYNNINEFYTIVTRGELGAFGLHDNTATNEVYTFVGGAGLGSGLSSAIDIDPFDGTTPITWGYQDTTDDVNFKWFIPLHGVVPWGATITEVEVTVDLSANPTGGSGSATTNLRLYTNNGTSDNDSNGSLTTAGWTHTLSVSRQINPSTYDYIALEAEITSDSITNYTATPLTIKYKL